MPLKCADGRSIVMIPWEDIVAVHSRHGTRSIAKLLMSFVVAVAAAAILSAVTMAKVPNLFAGLCPTFIILAFIAWLAPTRGYIDISLRNHS